MNRIFTVLGILLSAFILIGVSQAAILTFDDAVNGETSYFFDSDGDGNSDIILSTTDQNGYLTSGPGAYMSYIHEPGLEGTTLLNPDLRVDFLLGAKDSLKFGFALCDTETSDAWASFRVYDFDGNLITSEFEYGNYSYPNGSDQSNFPEGRIEAYFNGEAAYALFNFSTSSNGCHRYIIDNFEFNYSTVPDIKLLKIDLQEDSNEVAHHTDKYDPIVFRRAGVLNFNVLVSPGFDKNHHYLTLRVIGPNGMTIANIGSNHDDDLWYIKVGEPQPKSFKPVIMFDYEVVPLRVYVPYDIPIGKYEFAAIYKKNHGAGSFTVKEADDSAYLIFNPWSSLDDDVKNLFSTQELNEYILKDDGIIYKPNRFNWGFDQFGNKVFETTMQLVEDNLSANKRKNAYDVSRLLANMAKEDPDDPDGGVMIGRWHPEEIDTTFEKMVYYRVPPYTFPWSWSNSVDIFKDYTGVISGPVRWAQCWVFAGILNSMNRTLGIPSRPVTNMPSFHPVTNAEAKEYFGTPPPGATGLFESWNYHVWNDVWLYRQDRQDLGLPFSEAGWQALDGTYEMGPAPVAAIKNGGNGGLLYDVNYVRSEVRVNVQTLFYDPDTGNTEILSDEIKRSNHIYTPKVNSNQEKDLINDYCSDCLPVSAVFEEKNTFLATIISVADSIFNLSAGTAHAGEIPGMYSVNVTVNEPIHLGQTVNGEVIISNNSTMDDRVKAFIYVYAVTYDNKKIDDLENTIVRNLDIPAGNNATVPFEFFIPVTQKIVPNNDFYRVEVAVVGDIGNGSGEISGLISGPSLIVSASPVDGNNQSEVTGSLINTLPVQMNNLVLTIDVPSEVEILSENPVTIGNLPPGEEISANWVLNIPIGNHNVTVEAKADNLASIFGSTKLINAGPAALKLTMETPEVINVGETRSINVVLSNAGGASANATINIKSGAGLGNIDQAFHVYNLDGGTSETVQVSVQGTIPESSSIVALANMPNGESTAHATSVISVIGQSIQLSLNLAPETINSDQPTDVNLSVNSNASSDTVVNFSSIASDADKRYAIFDGSSRILSQPVIIPPGGKTLTLTVSESKSGGWIRVNAIPINDPHSVVTAELTITGQASQTVVDNLVNVVYSGIRYNRRTRLFSLTATITNTSDIALEGPVWLVINNLQPSEASLVNADGTQDGKPYIVMLNEGETWQAGESLPVVTLNFSNPTRTRLDFDEQVLAIVPNP